MGTLVVLAVVLLATDVSRAVFPVASVTPLQEYLAILLLVTMVAVLLLPFDFIGGIWIPATFETQPQQPLEWLKQWSRSVIIQLAFFSTTLFFYLQIGREIGAPWLIALFAALQVALVAGQELIWQLMTARSTNSGRGRQTQFVGHSDPRFAGGITGLPGLESILIPDGWKKQLPPSWLAMLKMRRQAALKSGGRFRGVVAAMLWNMTCFAAAVVAGGAAMNSVADLANIFLWFLLFSFMGLLILPMWNRRGVFALDRYLAGKVSVAELQSAIQKIDQLTERDPVRSVSAESVFQPIPCPERRAQALSKQQRNEVPIWNVARTALFLSWAFGGPLARAVHCNVGRPELWAMMPTD